MSRPFRSKAPKVVVDLFHPTDDHHAECVVELPREFCDFYLVSGVWHEGPLTGQSLTDDELALVSAAPYGRDRLAEAYDDHYHPREENYN